TCALPISFMSRQEQRARKGEQTRVAIIDAALDLAATRGLEGLTIGSLAERMRMSKSGVFAHFGSREDLQIAVLKEYERRFAEDVLAASLRSEERRVGKKRRARGWPSSYERQWAKP